MVEDVFRHPYEELRRITALPLAEVRCVGDSVALRRLTARMEASAAVGRVSAGPCTPATRLLVVDVDVGRLDAALEPAPSRTCVVLDLSGALPAARLPLPGMCLRVVVEVDAGPGLRACLLPRASTVPEALELAAELLYALGVSLEQRPVDDAPA